MHSLLDVDVLIALFDADHSLHRAALAWFSAHAARYLLALAHHGERLVTFDRALSTDAVIGVDSSRARSLSI